MGHKTHPIGFRLGLTRDWDAKWFAPKAVSYRKLLLDDLRLRKLILSRYPDAGISRVTIERGSSDLAITIHTARPGIVIGRGGQRIEELRRDLESQAGRRVKVNVEEIRQPELDAYLVARGIADQLERRVAFRRAMRQAAARTMQAGAKGVKVICSGRLAGTEIARREKVMDGRMPLHTLRADIDYGLAEANTVMGKIGVKVWTYRGDVLPELPEVVEELATIEVTVPAESRVEETEGVTTKEG
ncbi:MAG: 30S ribosomal protein S3 [Chloroflexi bacterium]|nr:30S ribosomal protein S3 [Chloroflexota bacterium]